MATFIGDYTCKVDVKGRVLLPSAFKKQMPSAAQDRFVVRKDIFEPCLVLHPMDEWEVMSQLIRSRINPYKREHNLFVRSFFRGTAELVLDASSRLLIPRRLLDLAGIEKEVVLAGQDGKIEVWASEVYDSTALGEADFAELAERIMGKPENEAD